MSSEMDVVTLANFRRVYSLKKRPVDGFGMIYKITPLIFHTKPNGYIGRTSQSMYWRLVDHACDKQKKYTLHRAIQKYGPANFTVQIVETNIPNNELPTAEKKYVAMYDTFRKGYNETEGGETAPMLCPQIRLKQKASLARPEVKEKFRKAGVKRMADPVVRAKLFASLKVAYKRPDVIARKSAACKKQRQDTQLEIQRGIAKRATTLRNRAKKRATFKTDKERRTFDLTNARQDRYLAKTGRSKTLQRAIEAQLTMQLKRVLPGPQSPSLKPRAIPGPHSPSLKMCVV